MAEVADDEKSGQRLPESKQWDQECSRLGARKMNDDVGLTSLRYPLPVCNPVNSLLRCPFAPPHRVNVHIKICRLIFALVLVRVEAQDTGSEMLLVL